MEFWEIYHTPNSIRLRVLALDEIFRLWGCLLWTSYMWFTLCPYHTWLFYFVCSWLISSIFYWCSLKLGIDGEVVEPFELIVEIGLWWGFFLDIIEVMTILFSWHNWGMRLFLRHHLGYGEVVHWGNAEVIPSTPFMLWQCYSFDTIWTMMRSSPSHHWGNDDFVSSTSCELLQGHFLETI